MLDTQKKDLRAIINALGGVSAVARACNITASAVSQWEEVPLKHIVTMLDAGKNKKLGIKLDHLVGILPYVAKA